MLEKICSGSEERLSSLPIRREDYVEEMKVDQHIRETLARMGVLELSAVIWVIEQKKGRELAKEIFELILSELEIQE